VAAIRGEQLHVYGCVDVAGAGWGLLIIVRDVANTMNASAVAGAAVEGLKLESFNHLQVGRHSQCMQLCCAMNNHII
jgi:hypothetical protein